MVAVPVAPPVTTPVVLTEAIAALLVPHTPPETASESVVVPPAAHKEVVPVIVPADGAPLTVKDTAIVRVPQLLLTV